MPVRRSATLPLNPSRRTTDGDGTLHSGKSHAGLEVSGISKVESEFGGLRLIGVTSVTRGGRYCCREIGCHRKDYGDRTMARPPERGGKPSIEKHGEGPGTGPSPLPP